MERKQIQIAGLPWFAEDDYESFRAVLPDRRWHASYGDWLRAAQQTKERLEQSGIRTVQAHVRSHAFANWCRDSGRDVDTDALTAFANEAAMRVQMDEKTH